MSHAGQQLVALHDFLKWETQSWQEVVADMTSDEKAYFMPVENLKLYFTASSHQELDKILCEVFKSRHPPVDSELILRDHTAIFCILLRIGQGRCIEQFVRYEELSDRRLPFDPDHPPTGFPEIDDDPTFLRRFCERQWMYCVPLFDGHMLHKHFGSRRLLPIIQKEPCGISGMANRYLIRVYGPHNKLIPAGKELQPGNPHANTFLLKRYLTKQGEAHYTQEVNGFRSVKNSDCIIKFYGSYIRGEEYNVLLEFADKGSLEEYFQRESPPSRGLDIIKFWEALFQLIKGLKTVHSVRDGHYDVNPESVVVLSNGADSQADWKFKLADFGLKNARGRIPGAETSTDEMQDSLTYGAPECYMPYDDNRTERSTTEITWSADIWSLGCIFSEAAMWIADGYKGLVDYRKNRLAETDRILFKGGDCFHDGERVLQSVLDAHKEIEDRLRRSDYITKDVLDSMVDEMLWEEDRPNAKALSRKAEMVSSRARRKVSGDEFVRPSSKSRTVPLPQLPIPTQPLPPLPPMPRAMPPGLSSISERQAQPNVEKWRSQVTGSQVSASRPLSALTSHTSPSQVQSSVESVSDLDRELAGSIASWQMAENISTASPLTPYTSPHVSVHYDYHKQNPNPNEGRPRALQSQSYEFRRPPTSMSHGTSYASNNDWDTVSVAPPPSEHPSIYTHESNTNSTAENWNGRYAGSDNRAIDETRTIRRTASVAGSRSGSRNSSSGNSMNFNDALSMPKQEAQIPPKSEKRGIGFTLFPARNRSLAAPTMPDPRPVMAKSFSDDSIPRSISSFSHVSGDTDQQDVPASLEYLSLNTCLEWKKAQKKAKKSSKVPPLPGAGVLEGLNKRDHVFIVDDSASMAPVWTDVKRVFEALSFLVKGMSPSGTELFYTISYDTYLRKDPNDLCTFLNSKPCHGETNISYRLNLQLEYHRHRIRSSQEMERARQIGQKIRNGAGGNGGKKGGKGEKGEVRPANFYVLTNGEWAEGTDPKDTIRKMVEYIEKEGLRRRQVVINFISFAQSAAAVKRINDVAREDFGIDMVEVIPWTGNLLKMLLGPLERAMLDGDSSTTTTSGRQSRASTIVSGSGSGAGTMSGSGSGSRMGVVSELG